MITKTSQRQKLIKYVNTIPAYEEFSSTTISDDTDYTVSYVSAVLGELRKAGKLVIVRTEKAKNGRDRYVYAHTRVKHIKENKLKSFTTKQLINELSRRIA